MANFKDIAGQKFGKLTVVKRAENDKYGNAVWFCECDCGGSINVLGTNLRGGIVRSCGCLHAEVMREVKHKQNVYDLTNEYGIGYTYNTNQESYFDIEDYEKIKDFCWLENDQGYIIASNILGDSPKNVRLHRLVTDFKYKVVDHKNLKRFDNRKNNLRYATKQTNNINRDVNKNNMLGLKGIYFVKASNNYQAKIQKGDKVYTKNSSDIDFLINWRREKELELYGEYAYKVGENNG